MALKFDIQGDNTQLMRQLQQVQAAVDKISGTIGSMAANGQGFGKVSKDMQSVKREAKETAGAFDDLKKAAGMTIAGIGLQQLASKIIDVREEFQMLEVSFSTLLGSDVKGKAMFKGITEFATKTPLLEKDLASAAQTMLGFNIEAEKVMPLLKQLGDISMGDSQKMQSLVLAFSQASSTGKLMGQDLLQMINAGFNPLAEIARTTGRSMADLKDDMSKGKISIEMLEGAFASATSEGGKYNGMLEKMSETMGGAFSNMEGAFQKLFNDIGASLEGGIVDGVNGVTASINTLAENLESIGKIVISVATAYGVYKAACLAVVAAQRAMVIWDTIQAFMQLTKWVTSAKDAMLLLNMVTKASPIGMIAAVVGVAAGGMMLFGDSTSSATKAMKEQAKEEDKLAKVRSEASNKMAEEQVRIEQLEKVASNTNASIGKRKQAIAELNKVIPQYNAHIDDTTNKYISSKKALDEYLKSLQKQYELEGAKEEIKKLSQERIQALVQQKKAKQAVDELANVDASSSAQAQATARMDAETIDKIVKKKIAVGALDMASEKLAKIEDQISAINAVVEPADSKSGSSGSGKGDKNAESKAANLIAEQNKYNETLKLLSIEAQNAIAQAVIDEEKNAAKKERMQRDLDHQLALQQIAKQADEMKKAIYEHNKKVYEASHKGKYENTAEGKKGISGVALTGDQQAIIDALTRSENAKYNQAGNDAAKAQEKALNDYLKEYGTYQEKRKAIAADYDRQIEDAALEGEKKTLQKQKEAMLQELDFTQFKDSIRWDVVFGDMSKATDRQLKEIRKKLKDFTKSKEFAKMSADSQKAVVDALTSANNESSERNPFMETANSLAEYKKSVDDCKTAEEDYKHAMLGGSEAVIKLTKANLDAAKATKEEKERKLADNIGKAGRAVSQSVTSIREMFSAFQNIDSNGGALGALEGIGQELEGVSKAWQSLLNMDIAGIVSGVSDVIVGQVKTIANLGGMLDVLSSADYSGYNKMVKQYKELIEVWDELIDRKTEYIEKSYGAEAVQASEEAIGLVNREVEAWRTLGKERLNSGASTGSHAIGSRQAKRTSEEDWRNIAKALNMTTAQAKDYIGTGRMTGLFDLTAEQLKSLQENAPEFWAKMDGDVKEYLESIIKSAKTIEQINDTTKQQLTNTSFDSLRESFVSTLSDMESSSADFADNFSNMLFNAVLNQQVGKLLDKELQEYYDMFSDYMEGKRTASELQQKWQAIVNQGTEIRNNVASATGYGTSTSQKATSKEIKSITEDTANQLVGRITTMQIAVEANKSNLSEIAKQVAMSVASLQGIGSLQTATSSMLQSIQLGMQSANEYLFDIAKASKGMYSDFANKLDKIVKNTDKL